MDIGERRKPQDGRITVKHNGQKVDLRVAALPTVWGEKIVMRILSTPSGNLKVEDLNFSQRNFDVFSKAYNRPYGLVLVTGPTGSGKSTTLYATLGDVARPEINIITVEDPVEFRMRGINQVQVNNKAGMRSPRLCVRSFVQTLMWCSSARFEIRRPPTLLLRLR